MNNIKTIRERRGINQTELARRVGTVASTISRIEDGKRKLSQNYLIDIACALSVEPADLLPTADQMTDLSSAVRVVGVVADQVWAVNARSPTTEAIPVIPRPSMISMDHAAYLVERPMPICPAGGWLICVPLASIRPRALTGDWLVVRSREGRLERTACGPATVNQVGVAVQIGDESVLTGGDHQVIGVVIGVYAQLIN